MEIRYRTYLLIALFGILVTSACKKNDAVDMGNWPVVISYLMPGQPISVKVYQQKDITDTTTYGPLIAGLTLTVTNGTKTITLAETATGTYTSADAGFLTAGKTYTLSFAYNGIPVTASTLMPAKPTGYKASRDSVNLPLITSNTPTATDAVAVTYTWNNPDSLYHVLVFKNNDVAPYNINPNRNSQVNFTLNPSQAAYLQVYYRTFNYIGIYKVILYSVNKEYIDVLKSNANSTSQKLTNPPGNVNNGYGIFTAMQADTVRLRLTQY